MNGLLRSLALLALVFMVTWARAAEQEPVVAVWKERQLHFSFQRSPAVHSCGELQNRVANVLRAVGARPDLKVTVRNCDVPFVSRPAPGRDGAGWPSESTGWPRDSFGSRSGYDGPTGPPQELDVLVQMSMPVEMTPEVIEELKADRKRRELIAEVTGDPLPLFDDPIAFTAKRRVVTLSRKTTGIKPADCELLDRLVTSSFKKLGVRVLRRGYTCHRGSVSRIAPTLDVEALIPTFMIADDDRQTPASSGEQFDPRVPVHPGEESARTVTDQQPE